MKIGLISRGRTLTSAIIATLAYRHKLKNLDEIYFSIFGPVKEITKLQENSIIKNKQEPIEIFKKKIKNLTEKNFKNENFVIKLWPSMLFYNNFNQDIEPLNVLFDKIKTNTVLNITDYWKIKNYDKLYFLDRNLNDSLYSWVYCKKTRYFQSYKTLIPLDKIIDVNEDDIQLAKEYILEYCLQQKLKLFLTINNLDYEHITNTDLFIDNDILRIQPISKNYKQCIKNIEILDKLVQDWYPICLDYTKDWQFY